MKIGVEDGEPLVDCDLENGRCRIKRAVNYPVSPAVPPAADKKCAFAAVPCRRMSLPVEAPDPQPPVTKGWWQGRHA